MKEFFDLVERKYPGFPSLYVISVTQPANNLGSIPARCPKSLAVRSHDILYTLSRDILYTSARASAAPQLPAPSGLLRITSSRRVVH
jgi:hypothetical protein